VQRIQNNRLNRAHSKLESAINGKDSRYKIRGLDELEIEMYEDKIYVPEPLRGRTLHWLHHYLNHPGGDHLAKPLSTVCYWKGLQNQAKKFFHGASPQHRDSEQQVG